MRVLGTAGHVDHGKSTLVRRLTGIDPDRLAEEKAREMTIDLGFAWLQLPNGETVGIVDVPGHRDFIENMLAGVGGIDAVLLVIAADEGVMPQTREHLAILDLLDIRHGLVVLTKTDLVDDPDWLELVEYDVRAILADTSLSDADIVHVSGRTGDGLDVLLERIAALVAGTPERHAGYAPRLPIDRVFTISGFGTVVTGTLLGGKLRAGSEIEIQPGGLNGRVRGLQSYKQPVEVAEPGSRVAVNISGIDKIMVRRGDVLTAPGQLHPATRVDVYFRHLRDASHPLKHNAEVKVFCGATEAIARARLLSDEILPPGSEGWLQLLLERPLALAAGDRFILRCPSPSETIGGGIVVNPHPQRRWKRFDAAVIADLQTRMQGSPADRVVQAASGTEPLTRSALQRAVGYSDTELDTAISEALTGGKLVQLSDQTFLAGATYHRLMGHMTDLLSHFHKAEPLRLGMPREELRNRVGVKSVAFNVLLASQDQIVEDNGLARMHDHTIRFNSEQQARADHLMHKLMAAPYTPPSFTEAVEIAGEDVVRALIDLKAIVLVQPEVIFSREVYEAMLEAVLEMIDRDGSVAANALRDRFNTTRKYAIGLLEYLDLIGVTRRAGDTRVRGSKSR